MVNKQRLLDMPRRQLQDLAKANKIRANLKSSDIIQSLISIDGPIRGLDEAYTESDRPPSDEANTANDDAANVDEPHRDDDDAAPEPQHPEESASAARQDDEAAGSPVSEGDAESDDLGDAAGEREAEDDPEADEPEREADEPESAAIEANAISDAPAADDAAPEAASVDGDECESNAEVASDDADRVEDVPEPMPTSTAIGGTPPTTEPDAAEPMSSRGAARKTAVSDSDVIEPSSDLHAADSVQDALDTYRKIAMQSNAELDDHGCHIPERPSSGKFVSAEAAAGAAAGKAQAVGVVPTKAPGKGEPGSSKSIKGKFDLQESLSRPISWEMKKGPLPPVAVQVLEDPNRLCLWSPSRMAERKKEFKNNDFGGTKRRLDDYMADGRSKLNEAVRDLRKAPDSTGAPVDEK